MAGVLIASPQAAASGDGPGDILPMRGSPSLLMAPLTNTPDRGLNAAEHRLWGRFEAKELSGLRGPWGLKKPAQSANWKWTTSSRIDACSARLLPYMLKRTREGLGQSHDEEVRGEHSTRLPLCRDSTSTVVKHT